MLRIMLLRFWPVLLPIAIYMLWRFSHRKRDITPEPEALRRAKFYVAIAMAVLAMGMFLWMGLSAESNTDTPAYSPPRLENGTLIKEGLHAR